MSLKLIYDAYNGEIDFSSLVSTMVNKSRYNPFKLPELIRTQDNKKVIRVINELKQDNVPLPLLIWIIANDARKNLNIKSEETLITLHEIDKQIKGAAPGDPWIGLERAIIDY